jgi:hypothetical protein
MIENIIDIPVLPLDNIVGLPKKRPVETVLTELADLLHESDDYIIELAELLKDDDEKYLLELANSNLDKAFGNCMALIKKTSSENINKEETSGS